MRNFKMLLQYEGGRYQGWQRQETTNNTIQGKLEAILYKLCGQHVEIQGSGRTDAGVHAKGQVANLKLDTELTAEELAAYLNRYLPEDIGVLDMEEVSPRFHARLNAKGKTYCYQVINSEVPHIFDRRYAYVWKDALNVEAMRRGAEYLLGTHDFAAFTSAKKSKKSTVRTIEQIRIEQDGDMLRLWYSGDGFLFHMVRILTGTLLEIGSGQKQPEDMADILASGIRERAGFLAPAQGLTLMEVRY